MVNDRRSGAKRPKQIVMARCGCKVAARKLGKLISASRNEIQYQKMQNLRTQLPSVRAFAGGTPPPSAAHRYFCVHCRRAELQTGTPDAACQ